MVITIGACLDRFIPLGDTCILSIYRLSDNKPRTCECRDLKEISGELVGWKDPTNPKAEWDPSPNQQARYFFQISARTLFLALSHTFHCFQTHLVSYISKL